jgi:hypothetical protein
LPDSKPSIIQLVICPGRAGGEMLLGLAPLVLTQGLHGSLGQGDAAPAPVRLRLGKAPAALVPGHERALHHEHRRLQVDVLPLQPEVLTGPHPGGQGEVEEGGQAIALGYLEEPDHLFGCQSVELAHPVLAKPGRT